MNKIIYMSNLARLAYKGWNPDDNRVDSDKLKTRVSEYAFLNKNCINIVEIDDLLYFTIEKDNEVYIAIRGSTNFKNWIRDIRFFKKKTNIGKVHSGFYYGALKIFKSLNLDKSKKYHISGHSMGSAICMILANMIYEEGYNIKMCIGIGSPRVGDSKYIKNTSKYKFTRWEICNHQDIVTNLPSWFQGFRHYKMLYINSKDFLKIYNWARSSFDQLKGKLKFWEKWQDHDSNLYCELLEKNKKELELI